jgi:hypothetical protein
MRHRPVSQLVVVTLADGLGGAADAAADDRGTCDGAEPAVAAWSVAAGFAAGVPAEQDEITTTAVARMIAQTSDRGVATHTIMASCAGKGRPMRHFQKWRQPIANGQPAF